MDMSLKHKELVEKAKSYLLELVPDAAEITFEEFGSTQAFENPANAVIVVLSFKDPSQKEVIPSLFSKKIKGIYMTPESGELLAVKNRFA